MNPYHFWIVKFATCTVSKIDSNPVSRGNKSLLLLCPKLTVQAAGEQRSRGAGEKKLPQLSYTRKGVILLCCSFCLLIFNKFGNPVQAKSLTPTPIPPADYHLGSRGEEMTSVILHRKGSNSSTYFSSENKTDLESVKSACPNQNLEKLTTQLLRNLPAYANRAGQRARRLSRVTDVFSYVLVAGRPEFKPLPLNPSQYTTDIPNTVSPGVEQVFFTTLERQYTAGKAVELQLFHWVFLTKTEQGWQFVMMFSQIGSYPKDEPPTPPQDTSTGIVAQAISDWLRDCRAGKIRVRSEMSPG